MQNNTFTKPKLLILSDSALGITGYGNQSKKIALTAHEHGWDVTHLSHNYWGQPLQKAIFEDGEIIPYKIIPGSTRVPYAQDKLQEILLKEKWYCFIIVLDTFMMFPFLLHINIPCKSVFWFPSDGGWFPHDGSSPQGCEAILQKVDFPIAMAEFGRNQVKRLFNIDSECIPLGVDTAKYYPFNNQERMRCREWISNKVGVDLRNKFIIGSVVRNQPRKAMDRTVKSIAYLEKLMPEVDYVLLWHTDANDPAAASNLKKLAERYKVSHRIVFTGMTAIKGFTDSEMVMLYNCMDLHLTSSTGEGFGIPLVEAASCGVPNVTTAYTTTKELVMDDNAGLGVQLVGQKLEDAHDNSEVLLNGTTTGSWHVDRGFIDCEHAAQQIKKLYDDRGLCKFLGSNGRKMAVEKYDWEGVIKPKWLRLLQKCLE